MGRDTGGNGGGGSRMQSNKQPKAPQANLDALKKNILDELAKAVTGRRSNENSLDDKGKQQS